MSGPIRLMVIAGEPSGDLLGAEVIGALKEISDRPVELTGVGGEHLGKLGLKSLYPLETTSIMGVQEALPKIPAILREVRELADLAASQKPDAVVLIDAPDFTHRVAKRLKKVAPDIPVIKYVAPQVWATRPWRAKKLGRIIDHQLALLPFEPEFFESYGLKTHFVGHPAVERFEKGDAAEFRRRHGIDEDATVLGVLCGSRSMEVRHLGPVFAETVRRLHDEIPRLHLVLPTVPHVSQKVRDLVSDWHVPLTIVETAEEKSGAFAAMDAALAASGTISTELALAGVPTVIAYKLGPITTFVALRLLQTEYVTLINIVENRAIMPEFFAGNCTVENLASATGNLLRSSDARAAQREGMKAALAKMGLGGEAPSRRAAKAILDIVG